MDYNKAIAEQMSKRRGHLIDAQNVADVPLFVEIREKHMHLARVCQQKIAELVAARKATGNKTVATGIQVGSSRV